MAKHMIAGTGASEGGLKPPIRVEAAAPPEAQVVFLPTNSVGTPGQLNTEILERLGLPVDLPNRTELRRGYYIEKTSRGLICFVVTVGNRPTAEALRVNFAKALADPQISQVTSLWVPLMGTGAGGLQYEESFSITLDAMMKDTRIRSGATHAVISVPDILPFDQLHSMNEQAQAACVAAVESSLSDEPDGPNLSDAARAALDHACALGQLQSKPRKVLSTTLLFFALSDSQSDAAPSALRDDVSADLFSTVVHTMAGHRYAAAWQSYFGSDLQISATSKSVKQLKQTENVVLVLSKASVSAGGPDKPIQIDHLVTALLKHEEAALRKRLPEMNVASDQLLIEYKDARLGQIVKKFNNDVAATQDRLGYDSYADAIYEFLVHVETPPPLSISIQAPWGAGKSSLMNLIREKLDPHVVREKHKHATTNAAGASRLRLGTVLRLLDREEKFLIKPGKAEDDGDVKRLWTIWFNAWKYDTTEQIWAGMVDAIVSQVADRLPLIEREKFLLKLQLARIDDGEIRKRIYDRVITIWWAKVRAWVLAGTTATLALFGLGAVKPDLPDTIQKALSLWGNGSGYASAVAAQIIMSVYLVGSYFKSRGETRQEPATFSLAEYIKVPDYGRSVGEIHQIHSDLRRVLSVVPRQPGDTEHAPIVIFIDDLDRCSPSKVAGVVEGVCMLLASDTYRCMFVIGMDPQMVAAALETAHKDVREQLPSYERAVPLGWRFMDKFIQLPFTIPPSGGRQFKSFVDWLVEPPVPPPPSPTIDVHSDSPGPVSDPITPASENGGEGDNKPIEGPRPPDKSSEAVINNFAESRDVGRIIRNIAVYSAGNPREMKRTVNLARFYLALRTAKRSSDPLWRAPDLDQYARWIVITLRWPDMLRWLQWGADEANWPEDQHPIDLVVRRLDFLQSKASSSNNFKEWRDILHSDLKVPIGSDSDWACDTKLFEFFKAEAAIPQGRRLSDAVMRGFW